jgi:hypothetical protein
MFSHRSVCRSLQPSLCGTMIHCMLCVHATSNMIRGCQVSFFNAVRAHLLLTLFKPSSAGMKPAHLTQYTAQWLHNCMAFSLITPPLTTISLPHLPVTHTWTLPPSQKVLTQEIFTTNGATTTRLSTDLVFIILHERNHHLVYSIIKPKCGNSQFLCPHYVTLAISVRHITTTMILS